MRRTARRTTRRIVHIATRGSALAMAQANMVLAQCRAAFPKLNFELKIIKTTGDRLQTASLAKEHQELPKGLFTKELEIALLAGNAELAVHSLKDLPTELPPSLMLGAVGMRADVRDVIIFREAFRWRNADRHGVFGSLPAGTVVATSSTRRRAQLMFHNPNLKVVEIRGNVPTRMKKLAESSELDATVLAVAGLVRLGYRITRAGGLEGEGAPDGLRAAILETDEMLPCVGQGAIGIEVRDGDEDMATICALLNDVATFQAVTAERAFLAAMGGGCQSPVAAHAERKGERLHMRVLSFASGPPRAADGTGRRSEAVQLGQRMAARMKGPGGSESAKVFSGRDPLI